MEPMMLGSPGSSPAANHSQYYPSFLLGEDQMPTTPRNTLSPIKGGRGISFAATDAVTSPTEFNRSGFTQKTLFNNQHTPLGTPSGRGNYCTTPLQSTAGPPIQGLFDSLRNDGALAQTSTAMGQNNQNNLSAYGLNQSYQQHQSFQVSQCNDSYGCNMSLNTRSMFSPMGPFTPGKGVNSPNASQSLHPSRHVDFWVTVYGFPNSAVTTILQHFAQCGTIIDKVFPSQNGNWVHLRYASRLECEKALNFNEKILADHIMIGVIPCTDKNIIEKENSCDNISKQNTSKIRSLNQTTYKTAQTDLAIVNSSDAPQKSSGLMNKAMDLFFGW